MPLTQAALYLLWYVKLREILIRLQRVNVTVQKRTNGIPEYQFIPKALQRKSRPRTTDPNSRTGEVSYTQSVLRGCSKYFAIQYIDHFNGNNINKRYVA